MSIPTVMKVKKIVIKSVVDPFKFSAEIYLVNV